MQTHTRSYPTSAPRLTALLILAGAIFCFNSCTKMRPGTYTMILEGTIYVSEGKAHCCDTTRIRSTKPYYEELTVHMTHVGNTNIEIDGNTWSRNGKSVSYNPYYDSGGNTASGKGGGTTTEENYAGTILSKDLIRGEYKKNAFSFVAGSKTWNTVTQGTFTIKKK